MKIISKLLLMAAAVSAAMTACEKPSTVTPEPEPEAPVLELSQTEVSVPVEGGTFSVSYRITNPVEGEEVTVTVPDAIDWIANVKVDDSTVIFDVAASTVLETRMASLTVGYPGAKDVALNVVQAAYEPDFLFEITRTTASTITFNITPKDPEMYYVLSCYTKEEMEEYGYDSDEAIIEDEMSLYELILEYYGITWEEYAYQGAMEDLTYSNLPANTECVLWAYGIDVTTGTPCTEIVYAYASTTEATASDMTIDIAVSDISARSATVTVTPSNDTDPYIAVMAYADEYAGMSDEEILASFEEYGYLEGDTITGVYEETVAGLDPETEFVVFAVGCDGGVLTTGLFKASFTTPEAVLGSVTLTVENGDYYDAAALDALYPNAGIGDYIEYYGVDCILMMNVTTSEPVEEYYFAVVSKEEIDLITEYYGEDYLSTFVMLYGYGPDDMPVEMFMYYGQEAVNVGFAVDGEGNWGPLYMSEPYTLTAEGASDPSTYEGFATQTATKSAGIGIKAVSSFEKSESIFVRERVEAPANAVRVIARNPKSILK